LHNRFDIEVIDTVTGKIKQHAFAENIICDSLWVRLLTPSTYFSYIHYGTGSGTPSSVDTSLFTFLGAVTASDYSSSVDYDSKVITYTRSIQLSETTAVGETLTEVGIGYGADASNLVTHAMLKDMNGNIISIAKTATDIINIYATLFLHWSSFDSNSIKCILHPDMSPFARYLLGLGTFTYALNFAVTKGEIVVCQYRALPNYYFPGIISVATPTYNVASKQITYTATRLAVGVGNDLNGIRCLQILHGSDLYRQCLFGGITACVGGTWYPGTDITGEAIGTGDGSTVDFNTTFPFISNATIYVDGVESADVTLDEDLPNSSNEVSNFLEFISATTPNSGYSDNGAPAPYNSLDDGTETWWGKTVVGATSTWYNPYYARGITAFNAYNCTVQASDDLITWATVTTPVAAGYQHMKYWRLTATSVYGCVRTWTIGTAFPVTNIHFGTAPASGAVVTADYTTKTIAKDTNHVFDFSLTITLAEKTV